MSSKPSIPADTAVSPAHVWVTGSSGCHLQVSAAEAALLAEGDSFAWIDLQETGDAGLRQVSDVLNIDAETFETLRRADRRPSFMPLADATYAAAPVIDPSSVPSASLHPPYVCFALTERFLLTRHSAPCPVLREIRDRYGSLTGDAKSDGPALLFTVLDSVVREIEPQLLLLDDRLNQIQVMLMTSTPPRIQDEIMRILRSLTACVQGLTWYCSDLDDVAGTIGQLPGMRGGSAAQCFSRHRDRVSRMRESAGSYREAAKDAFDQYASNTANRQGQLINVLTVVATLFLPLSFLTGYFGMNFGVIVNDLNATWAFVLLGVVLPAASVTVTLLLYRKLLRRFGVGKLTEPGSHA